MNRSDAHHIRDLIFQAHQKHGDDTAAMARELLSIRAHCKSLAELAEIWAWEEAMTTAQHVRDLVYQARLKHGRHYAGLCAELESIIMDIANLAELEQAEEEDEKR